MEKAIYGLDTITTACTQLTVGIPNIICVGLWLQALQSFKNHFFYSL